MESVYLRKYHDESTNVSMVSVSRFAGVPHLGQSTLQKDSLVSKGFPLPSNMTSLGNSTGRSSSGTGTTPHDGQ